jgi:AraC family ethanolamine operon transcriptional activator
MEQHEDEFLSMEDLTFATGVSERTLRKIFLEYYGLPPRRFQTVQRLNRVRATLREADPECARVTTVAAQFGFWHFGRFAGEYRRLFGEAPFQTLKLKAKR